MLHKLKQDYNKKLVDKEEQIVDELIDKDLVRTEPDFKENESFKAKYNDLASA